MCVWDILQSPAAHSLRTGIITSYLWAIPFPQHTHITAETIVNTLQEVKMLDNETVTAFYRLSEEHENSC